MTNIKYQGHSIKGNKKEGYWSYAMGRDVHGKTIAEVKDAIYRLEHGGLSHIVYPRRKNPRTTGAKKSVILPIVLIAGVAWLIYKNK